MRKGRRTFALLLAVLLVVGVLCGVGSAFLLVRYPGHTCCGERCHFCGVLNAVDVLLRQGSVLLGTVVLVALLLAAVVSRICRVRVCRFALRTPITLKTKLLN